MKKKVLAMMLLAVAVLALAACGEKEPEYPVMEDPKEPANMQEQTYDGITASYDADKWVFDSSMNNFAIYDKSVFGSEADLCPNINIVAGQNFDGQFTTGDMDNLMAEMEKLNISGISIEKNEMRTFNGEPIIYYELKTQLTDDMLDLMVSTGEITEDDINALGGREELKNMGATNQIGINAVVDGRIIMVTGTYLDDSTEILEAMKLLMKTAKIS